MREIDKVKWSFRTVLVFSLVLLCGCVVGSEKYRVGEALEEKQLIKILPGKTTKQEILQWFGPPLAVARKGIIIKIPSPDRVESYDIDSEVLFETFSPRHKLTEKHIIYYYWCAVSKSLGGLFLFIISDTTKLVVDELWVLINNETGLVEDYIFREQK